MEEDYKKFDGLPKVDSEIVIKGYRVRIRELALGLIVLFNIVIIVILAALLGSAKSSNTADSQSSFQAQCEQACFSTACLRTAAYATELISNRSSDPCEDFHTFACSNFRNLYPLEPDEPEMTTFLQIYNKNQDKLRRLVERPDIRKDPNHYETKMRSFFFSCEDHFTKMQQQGKPFLNLVVTPSGGWWALKGDSEWASTNYDFQEHLRKVHVDFWTNAFFTFSIASDWLDWNKGVIQIDLSGIGINYGYFNNSAFIKEVNAYKEFVRTVGGLLIRDAELNLSEDERNYRVETFVEDALLVEHELSVIKQNSPSTPDPHATDKRRKLSELDSLSGGAIQWTTLFTYMFNSVTPAVTGDTYVVVLEEEYVDKFTTWLNNMDTTNKSRILNNYMVWRLANRYVQDLSWDYIHANRQIYVDLTGVAEFLGTWRYCLNKLDWDMKDALGALFVQDHFSDQNRASAHMLTDYVRGALRESLSDALHWMSSETKQIAMEKLDASLIKLGYPDYMMSDNTLNAIYQVLKINESDYFGNVLSFNGLFRDQWNKLLSNYDDRTVWVYSTYSFIAEYYNPWKELIVPAGMLQFPIFDHTSPNYMNYGSMGSIVGRQLTHAIDEIGNQYMLNGSHYGTWWSNATTTKYKEVRQCIVEAYQNLTMGPFQIPGADFHVPAIPVNANAYAPRGLGESSGIKLAFRAYHDWAKVTGGEKSMPGLMFTNDQMFFISYAQSFCYNRDPYESLNLALRGTTIPENLRVNSALAQLKEFQDAFKCQDSSKMVAPKRCNLY